MGKESAKLFNIRQYRLPYIAGANFYGNSAATIAEKSAKSCRNFAER